MPSFYPAPLDSPLIPYHVDGSLGYNNATTGSPVALTALQMEQLNRHWGDTVINSQGRYGDSYTGIQFAHPIDIHYWMANGNQGGNATQLGPIQWSTNSTNFVDGTWTNLSGSFNAAAATNYFTGTRNNVISSSITGVTHVRCRVYGGPYSTNWGSYLRTMLFFGQYTNASSLGLALWHPTLDERITGADLWREDVARGNTSDKQFRVKNLSSTLTANSITVNHSVSAETSPASLGLFSVSSGGTFGSSVNIGNLGPGAVSGILTSRFSPIATSALGPGAMRLNATAGSWT